MKKLQFPEPRLIRASSITASLPETLRGSRPGIAATPPKNGTPRVSRGPRQPAWTAAEDAVLRKHYPGKGRAFCAAELGRSQDAVVHRAQRLGIASDRLRTWTTREEAMLRLQYGKLTAQQLAIKLKRSLMAVRLKLRSLGLIEPSVQRWTDDDLAYLCAHYNTMSYAAIASELGRTEAAIELKVQRLGLAKVIVRPTKQQELYVVEHMGKRHYTQLARELGLSLSAVEQIARNHGHRARPTSRKWTEDDDATLRELFPTMTNEELATHLNRTVLAVTVRAQFLGLYRRPDRARKTGNE